MMQGLKDWKQRRALRGRSDADMTQGTIWKLLMQFAIPMMVGQLFQQLYNTVDTIVVCTASCSFL